MRRLLLLMALAGSIALLAGAGDGGTYRGGTYRVATATYSGGKAAATTPTESTTYVFKVQWDTTTVAGGGHLSPFEPTAADLVVKDPDGSLFKYGHVRQDAPTAVQYSSSANRIQTITRDGAFPIAANRTAFYVWPLDTIPSGSTIISAKLTFNITVGISEFTELQRLVAVIDTTAANYQNYVSGAAQVGNTSYHQPAWDYAVGTTPWTFDLDNGGANNRKFSDFGFAQTVIPPGTVSATNWWEADITSIVQKYTDLGLQNKPIWFFADGGGGSTYYWNIGPNTGSWAIEPLLTVTFSNKSRRAPVRFAAFSDNHSNSHGVGVMKATLDAAGFSPDFLVHNGDMNLANSCDSTITQAGVDSVWTEGIPVAWVEGNHEINTLCAEATAILGRHIPTANKAFIASLPDFGGVLRNLGALGTQEKRFRSFSFDVGQAHIVCLGLESIFLTGDAFTATDSTWLYRDLTATSQPVTIVFSHHPLFYDYADLEYPASPPDESITPPDNSAALQAMLEDLGVDAYVAGHAHLSWYGQRNGVWYIHLPSTKADKVQGFSTFSISESGAVTVEFYRGVQDDATWANLHTLTF